MLERPECTGRVGRRQRSESEEPFWFIDAITIHKCRSFGLCKFSRDFIRQPTLNIKRRIIKHRLTCRGIGIKIAHWGHDFIELRRCRFRPRRIFRSPARHDAVLRHELAVASAADTNHIGDSADWRDALERRINH